MIITLTSENSDEYLFMANMIAANLSNQTKTKDFKAEGSLNTIFKKSNRIAVGKPYYQRLSEQTKHFASLNGLQVELEEYEFHLIALSCSFLPADGCKFVWARLSVELYAYSRNGDKLQDPIVMEMFPEEIFSEKKVSNEVTVNKELKISFRNLKYEAGTTSKQEASETLIYEPEIIAFGVGRSSVAWQFSSTNQKGLLGNKKGLMLMVKSLKGSLLRAKFLLGAKIDAGKLLGIPLRREKDKLIDTLYEFE